MRIRVLAALLLAGAAAAFSQEKLTLDDPRSIKDLLQIATNGVDFAYLIQDRSSRYLYFINNDEAAAFDQPDPVNVITWNRDGTDCVCQGQRDGKWYVTSRNGELGPFDETAVILWSADKGSCAVVGLSGGAYVVYKNGARIRSCPSFPELLRFSPQGGTLYQALKAGGKTTLYLDGSTLGTYDRIVGFQTGAAEGSYSFYGTAGGRTSFVLNGTVHGPYDMTEAECASSWPAGGGEPAYTIKENGKIHVITGARKLGPYTDAEDLQWSPVTGALSFQAGMGGKRYVIKNGAAIGPFTFVNHLAWSPKTGALAFRASTGKGESVYIDSKPAAPYDSQGNVLLSDISWSPDGKSVAYKGSIGGTWYLFKGAVKYGPYEEVGSNRIGSLISWSPDSRAVLYEAVSQGQLFVYRNGEKVRGPLTDVYGYTWANGSADAAFAYEINGNHYVGILSDTGFRKGPFSTRDRSLPVTDLRWSTDGQKIGFTAVSDGKRYTMVCNYLMYHGGVYDGRMFSLDPYEGTIGFEDKK